jgi:hypothetical protein
MKRFHMLYVFAFKMLDEMFTNEKVGIALALDYSSRCYWSHSWLAARAYVDVPVPLGL